MTNQTADHLRCTTETAPRYGWYRRPRYAGGQLHVLVLNHNGCDLLGRCLPSIVQAAVRTGGGAAVTVVDNDSSDESRTLVLRSFPSVGLYRARNRSLASFNEVVAKVGEPLVALSNNDVFPSPETFDRLVRVLRAAPEAFAAAPTVRSAGGGAYEGPRARLRFRRGILHTELDEIPSRDPGNVGYAPSAGVLLVARRSRFLALGGFSAVYFPGRFEDLELCWRAWRAGWPVLAVEDVTVEHLGSMSFRRHFPPDRLRYLDSRNALVCTLRNIRSPWRLARCLLWAMLRMGSAACRADTAQAAALCHGLTLGFFSRNRWPAPLRRRSERALLRVLGCTDMLLPGMPAMRTVGAPETRFAATVSAEAGATPRRQQDAALRGADAPWAA